MKNTHFLIGILIALLPVTLRAQDHRYSIGVDAGSRAYHYTYTDPGGRLLNEPVQLREAVGISARWYASERWTTEVGFQRSIFNQKDVNFTFLNPERISAVLGLGQAETHYYVRQYYNALIVRPFKGVTVAFGPHVGIGFSRFTAGISGPYSQTVPGGGPNNEPEEIKEQTTVEFPLTQTWALEAGLNAHIMLGRRVHLRYQFGRIIGLAAITNIGITYESSLNPGVNAATISSRGTGWLHSGLIAYRFGRANPPSQRRVREK